jgi:predicted anti-sigma-YlaC factor YlaD
MADAELGCRELVELVTEYLEGALAPTKRARLEEHLAGCVGCRDHLDQMRRTISAVGHLPEEEVSPTAQQELLAVFRAWKGGASES